MKVKIVGTPKKKVKIVGLPKNQAGGRTPVVNGLPSGMEHMANIEAEAGEVYQDHDGGINKISDQAPSHEQGGAFIPNAQRVLEDTSMDRKDKASKTLKMSPDEVHTIFGVKPKRPLSHAKAYEFVKGEYGKDVDRFNKEQKGLNEKPNFDRTKYNTARLNFINREDIPTDQDVFDTLFEHQEAIKAVHGIENDGKSNKYGGWKAQAGGSDDTPDFGLYHGPKYPQDKSNLYTPTGKTSEAKLSDKQIADAYKAVGQNFNGLKGGKLQSAIYNYLIENQPDVLRQTLKEYGANKKALVGRAGNLKAFKDPQNATADDLKKAIPFLVDNMPGARIPLPSSDTQTTPPAGTPPSFQPSKPQVPGDGGPVNPNTPTPEINLRRGSASKFYEPTNWYDLAPGLAELEGSFTRDPELYNPVQIHELNAKLLDPTAALRANQGDYNAALHALDTENLGSGARAANISNLTAEKYRANNQISAEYENQNAGIKNREIEYNTQARDRQSMADAQSRKEFYTNVLQGRDNQRLQRLQAIQDLSRVQQLKARQNASGNLILQTTPHFNQEGEYNGNQYVANLPPELMGDGSYIPQPPTKSAPAGKSTTTTTWKIGDKTYRTNVQNPVQ
jgi:hypothetical protein